MLSFGEVAVIVVATAWVIGPNELPRVARAAGRLTGQATGFLYRTRAKLFKYAEETEVTKLHEEMQATMHQLNAIRSELQGGINIFAPGPLTQRALSIRPIPGQDVPDPFQQYQQQQYQVPPAGAQQQQYYQQYNPQQYNPQLSQQVQHPSVAPPPPLLGRQQQQPPVAGSWASSAVQPHPPVPHLAEDHRAPHVQQQQQQPMPLAPEQQPVPLQQQRQPMGGAPEEAGQQHPLTVPVSAVSAGWAPNRAGTTPTGSEILLDALAEELLAAQVLRLQRQQWQQQQALQQQQQPLQ